MERSVIRVLRESIKIMQQRIFLLHLKHGLVKRVVDWPYSRVAFRRLGFAAG